MRNISATANKQCATFVFSKSRERRIGGAYTLNVRHVPPFGTTWKSCRSLSIKALDRNIPCQLSVLQIIQFIFVC
jgi:hypothetical protein